MKNKITTLMQNWVIVNSETNKSINNWPVLIEQYLIENSVFEKL